MDTTRPITAHDRRSRVLGLTRAIQRANSRIHNRFLLNYDDPIVAGSSLTKRDITVQRRILSRAIEELTAVLQRPAKGKK